MFAADKVVKTFRKFWSHKERRETPEGEKFETERQKDGVKNLEVSVRLWMCAQILLREHPVEEVYPLVILCLEKAFDHCNRSLFTAATFGGEWDCLSVLGKTAFLPNPKVTPEALKKSQELLKKRFQVVEDLS